MNRDTSGVGFLEILAVLLIGLKLTGHITWSWIWVLSPLWIPMGIALLVLSVGILIVGLGIIVKTIKYERKEK